jgi:hypothetical protein
MWVSREGENKLLLEDNGNLSRETPRPDVKGVLPKNKKKRKWQEKTRIQASQFA